jgi:hypothetical protein
MIGGWVVTKAGLDAMEKKRRPYPTGNQIPIPCSCDVVLIYGEKFSPFYSTTFTSQKIPSAFNLHFSWAALRLEQILRQKHLLCLILLTKRIEALYVWLRNSHLKDGSWVVKSKKKKTLEVQQMGLLRPTVGCTLTVKEQVSVANTVKDIEKYRGKWGVHVEKREGNRLSKRTMQYIPW